MLDPLDTGPALIDQVHDQLVAAVASGDLKPGQRVTQESVAQMLGVSRQPVSHALQILKRRGLLVEHGRRGLAVAHMEPERIRDLYQVRAMLDGLAARLAARRCQSGAANINERAALSAALEKGSALAAADEKRKLVAADVAFHEALHRLSGNPEIARTVAEQWPQFMRSMGFVLDAPERASVIWQEHRSIAEAVLFGNQDDAEALARAHADGAARQAVAQMAEADAA